MDSEKPIDQLNEFDRFLQSEHSVELLRQAIDPNSIINSYNALRDFINIQLTSVRVYDKELAHTLAKSSADAYMSLGSMISNLDQALELSMISPITVFTLTDNVFDSKERANLAYKIRDAISSLDPNKTIFYGLAFGLFDSNAKVCEKAGTFTKENRKYWLRKSISSVPKRSYDSLDSLFDDRNALNKLLVNGKFDLGYNLFLTS